MDKNKVMDLAKRIFELSDPWDIDYATVEEIAEDIENDPLATIDYILGILEDLQA